MPTPETVIEISEDARAFSHALAWFSRGHQFEMNREFPAALLAFQRALELDPENDTTHFRVALNLMRLNRSSEAVDLLSALAARRPDDAQPLIWLGSAYRQQEDMDGALTTYQAALMRDPENAALYVQVVDILIQRGDVTGAMALLQDGISKVDEPLNLHRILGELYMRQAALQPDPIVSREYIDRALESLRQAQRLAPNDAALLNALGDLELRKRNWEAAITYFEQAAALEPEDLAAKERLAFAYEVGNRLADAARVLEEMAALQPTNERIFLALGSLYERLEEREKAILNYQLASRLGRPDPAAYLKLAVLQMESNPTQAVTELQEGLSLMPDQPRLLEMLGYVHFNLNAYDEAINAFSSAERQWDTENDGPITPNFNIYYALALYFDSRFNEIPPILWRAIENAPDALEAFTHFVFQDEDDARIAEAIPVHLTLLEKDPDNITILTMLAYLYSFQKQYAEAIPVFDQVYALAKAQPDGGAKTLTARFYFWYAAAHEREGMIERAEDLFYQCIEVDPQNVEAYNYLAYMWAEKGINLDKAKEYVTIALDARPESAAFLDTLGWIYYQQGRYEDAYTEIRRAEEIMPDDPTILEHLGDIYLKMDDLDNALTKWKRAYTMDPDNDEVSQKLIEYGVDLDTLRDETIEFNTPAVEQDTTEQPEEESVASTTPSP